MRGSDHSEEKRPYSPSVWLVHLALISCQCFFGVGSVVGKLGVSKFNPMMFALIREAAAGVLLLLWALRIDGRQLLKPKDVPIFLGCGLFIFLNQAGFIIGDKLAGPILASAWQPTQPIFTLLISLCLGWEGCSLGKVLGIIVSFSGAAFMVCYGADLSSGDVGHTFAGNILLALNCVATSLYVIVAKLAFRRGYPPCTVTAWSYLFGACMMLVVASGFSSSCQLVAFICPEDPNTTPFDCGGFSTSCKPWSVPTNAILPLCYWVLFNSCGAYLLMTWANRYAQPGFVLAYCALQPLVSTALSALIIAVAGSDTDLKEPGLNALGAIAIVLGLVLILKDGKRQHEREVTRQLLVGDEGSLCARSASAGGMSALEPTQAQQQYDAPRLGATME